MTPEEQAARDQDLRKANALLGHWMGGINPCTCWRCQDVADALRTAREEGIQEGVEAAIEWPHEHGEPLTTQNVDRLYAAIRAREKQT